MYPPSNEESLLEQLEAERAISDLVELALQIWLPLAQRSVLQAAVEPPPNAAGAAEQEAQWNYLVDALILYGIGVLASDAYDQAYTAVAGVPLAVADAVTLSTALFDLPGMPTRADLGARARAILSRRTGIDADAADVRMRSVPQLGQFVTRHLADIRGKVVDAVGRVFRRVRSIIEDSPPDQARADVAPVFHSDDPEWMSVADLVGQTQATSTLNSATYSAVIDAEQGTGRAMVVEWVAILDARTREAHADADGQQQPLGTAFTVGGEPLRFPADPRGSIDNTAGCRCRLFARFTEPSPELTAAGPATMATETEDTTMAVTGSTDLPVGDRNATWDGDAAAQRVFDKYTGEDGSLDVSQVSRAFMWHEGDGTNRGDYKLGFADVVDDELTVIPRGVAATAGGRGVGAADIPQTDKAAIENKICTLYGRIRKKYDDWPECPFGAESNSIRGAAMDYRSFTTVLAVIGTPTDDGRMFSEDIALSFREFPLPLLWQKQSADGHVNAFTVGVIESAEVVGSEVIGQGYLLNTPEADEAAMQIEHGVTGPSVDLGDAEWELRNSSGQQVSEQEYYANPDMDMIQTVTSAKVLAATLVSTPAFGQTSITLGAEVVKGEDVLVAAAGLPKPGLIDVPIYPADMFSDPGFTEPTLPHITDDGRIQGHLAAFNVCHTGIQDACVIAPRSQTDYAWFHTAPAVKTDAGKVKVGRLTVGGGHAGPRLSAGPAIAHYDDAGTCFALVHAGEDEHGIWFSGVPAPGATAEQITAGLAAPLSGDWRNVGGNLELVAALAVNTPGFPIIASGATDEHDEPLALVASLGPCASDEPSTPTTEETVDALTLARHIVTEWRAAEKRESDAFELVATETRRQAQSLIQGGQ